MSRRVARRAHLALAAGAVCGAACGPLRPFGRQSASGAWQRRAGLLLPRDDFGFAAAGKRLYAVGGMAGARGNALDSVEAFDAVTNTWSRVARLPAVVSSVRAAAVDGRIVLVGGARSNEEVAAVWSYATEGGRWEPAAPLGTARLGHGLAALGGRLFAAGGLNAGEPLASVERYDPRRDAWQAVAPLPQPRFNLGLVAFRDRLYAVGGAGADRRPATSVFVYEPEQDRWGAGPALPQPMSNFGAAALGERSLHAILHRLHFVFDGRATTWLAAPPMPTARHGLGLAALDGALYAAGGCSEDPQRDLPTLEVFRPAT